MRYKLYIFFALFLISCGSQAPSHLLQTALESCDLRNTFGMTSGICMEKATEDEETFATICDRMGGIHESEECPIEEQTGGCFVTHNASATRSTTYFYYLARYSRKQAKTHCQNMRGLWLAPEK